MSGPAAPELIAKAAIPLCDHAPSVARLSELIAKIRAMSTVSAGGENAQVPPTVAMVKALAGHGKPRHVLNN